MNYIGINSKLKAQKSKVKLKSKKRPEYSGQNLRAKYGSTIVVNVENITIGSANSFVPLLLFS